MGRFIFDANADVNPALLSWIQAAAANSGYDVRLQSGYRPGDPRYHGQRKAIDVQLIDPKTRQVIPNYQNASSFAAYQGFANQVRAAQMATNPELANALRWGGYFSGGKGKYGAFDLMHFDIGGDATPMGGGGWDTGLTPQQAALWGLQPGGGYSGTSGPTLASTFSNALAPAATPPAAETNLDRIATGLGEAETGVGRRAAARRQRGAQGPLERPTQPVGTAQPSEAPRAPAASPVAPQGVLDEASLADLFKVKEIGSAGQPKGPTPPYQSTRRWA